MPQGWHESLAKRLTDFNHCKSRASSPWEVQPVVKDSLEISKASTFQSAEMAPALSSWHCQCCAKFRALEPHRSQVLPAITQVGSRDDKAYGGEKLSRQVRATQIGWNPNIGIFFAYMHICKYKTGPKTS